MPQGPYPLEAVPQAPVLLGATFAACHNLGFCKGRYSEGPPRMPQAPVLVHNGRDANRTLDSKEQP